MTHQKALRHRRFGLQGVPETRAAVFTDHPGETQKSPALRGFVAGRGRLRPPPFILFDNRTGQKAQKRPLDLARQRPTRRSSFEWCVRPTRMGNPAHAATSAATRLGVCSVLNLVTAAVTRLAVGAGAESEPSVPSLPRHPRTVPHAVFVRPSWHPQSISFTLRPPILRPPRPPGTDSPRHRNRRRFHFFVTMIALPETWASSSSAQAWPAFLSISAVSRASPDALFQ